MARGRKARADRPVEWKLRIPASVARAITATILDPITGEPMYGERSKLTEQLYRKYLKEQGINIHATEEKKDVV